MKESIKILVVEDDSLISLDIQRTLRFLGYGIAGTAATGAEAIELVRKIKPDLILLDISLRGGMDGIEAATIIKSEFDIAIVYLTAYADEATLERAKLTEPLGYLLKPFEQRELNSVLQMAIYKHNLDKKLRDSEKWLSTTLRSIGDGVIATDSHGKIIFMNSVAEELTGWKIQDASGLPLEKVFNISNEDTNEIVENPVQKVLRDGKIIGLANHTVLRDKKGIVRFIMDTASPILDDDGSITGVVLIFQDITNQKLSELAVRTSEQKFRSIFEKTSVGFVICSTDGTIIDSNNTFLNFTLYSIDELKSNNFYRFLTPHFAEIVNRKCNEITGKNLANFEEELKIIRKDGTDFWGHTNVVAIAEPDNNYFIIVIQDITKRKETEIALNEHEMSYKTLVESSIDPIYVLQGKKLLMVNHAWEILFGYSKAEVYSDNFNILDIVAPESRSDIEEKFSTEEEYSINSSRYEMKAVTKDGRKVDLDVSVSRILWKGSYAYQGIYRDITGRKLEEEKLKYAIEQGEKSNRLKNEFLAQMSHEIRTPLNNILTFTSLLKEELGSNLPEGLESTFSVISNSAQRLIRTIESILNLSRIQTGNYEAKYEKINLHKDILEDLTLEFYLRVKDKGLDIVYDNASDENSNVMGDKYSISQIFVNLIDNSIKYTQKGGIKISLKSDENFNIVVIEDTGIGISEEFLPNLFNPFTQEDSGNTRPFEGTGLGLALVKKYVDINNAQILVESRKNEGTKFKIIFPSLNN